MSAENSQGVSQIIIEPWQDGEELRVLDRPDREDFGTKGKRVLQDDSDGKEGKGDLKEDVPNAKSNHLKFRVLRSITSRWWITIRDIKP